MLDVYIIAKNTVVKRHVDSAAQFRHALFTADAKIVVEELITHVGGGAVNTASALQTFGLQVAAVYAVGCDQSAARINSFLATKGVDLRFVQQLQDLPSGLSYIVVDQGGEHLIFAAKLASTQLALTHIPWPQLADSNFIYVTSLEQQALAVVLPVLQFARERNIAVVVNPGCGMLAQGAGILCDNLASITLLQLNSSEAHLLALALKSADGCLANGQLQIKRFLALLLQAGVQIVVITDGCHGAYAAADKHGYFIPSATTTVVDAVGAGDAFGAIFAANVLAGKSIPDALRLAVIASSATIKQLGACAGHLSATALQQQLACANVLPVVEFEL